MSRAVHGNLSCVVISLIPSERPQLLSLPSRSPSIPPRVLYRWKLIELVCKYHIHRRYSIDLHSCEEIFCSRTCLRRWWHLISQAVRDAQRHQLESEKAHWEREVHGTAHVSLIAHGMEKRLDGFPCKIGSGFRRWLDAPSCRKYFKSHISPHVSQDGCPL